MAKNRAHEEVTESDSSSGTCVKFRFYEEMKERSRRRGREEAEDRYTAFEKIVNLFALLYYDVNPCEKL